jgi:hypothetical protein
VAISYEPAVPWYLYLAQSVGLLAYGADDHGVTLRTQCLRFLLPVSPPSNMLRHRTFRNRVSTTALRPHGHPAAVRHVGVFDYIRNQHISDSSDYGRATRNNNETIHETKTTREIQV